MNRKSKQLGKRLIGILSGDVKRERFEFRLDSRLSRLIAACAMVEEGNNESAVIEKAIVKYAEDCFGSSEPDKVAKKVLKNEN